MAIAFVASVTKAGPAGGGTTSAIDTTGATLLVLHVGYVTSALTVTDSKGNAWAPLTTRVSGSFSTRFYACFAPIVGSGHTFTVTGASSFPAIIVTAFSGVASYQTESGATGASSPLASGSVTPAANGALVLTGRMAGAAATNTLTPSGFTRLTVPYGASVNVLGDLGYLVQTTAAAIDPTWAWTGAPANNAVVTAVFLPAAPASALVRVQRATAVTTTASTSIALVFATPPVLGRGVVVVVSGNSATALVTTCVDSAGNSYSLAHAQNNASGGRGVAVWYCPAITATGASFTVTVTGASVLRVGVAIEVSGVGVGLIVDQTVGASTTSVGGATGATAALTGTDSLQVAAVALALTVSSLTVGGLPTAWTEEAEARTASQTGEVDSRDVGAATGTTPSAIWAWGAGSAFVACALVAFKPGAPVTVTVPDVVGETEAAADALLVAAGLTTGTVTTATSDTVAAGLVISQSPAAGASVSPGSAVDVVVSTGTPGPPVYVIGIGETEVTPLLATFRIQETIDAPDTMIADVFSDPAPPSAYQAAVLADGASAYWPLDDPSGTTARDLVGATPVFARFSLGQPVVVTENGVRIFGGVVTGTRERGLTGPSATDLVVEIQATSYELSAARRVITAAISQDGAETIGAAFATLVTDYYAEVDVTLHPDQVAGPALPAATFTRSRGDAVNKTLASSVGYLQSIDFENRLRAWAPGDVLAPANYDEATNPELLTGDITVERQLQNGYANRVILTGDPIPVPGHIDHYTGDGTTNVWPVTYVVNGPYPYFVDGAVAQGVIQYPATSTTESIGGVESPPGFLWEYDPIAHTIHRRSGPVAAGVAFDFPYDGLFIPAGMAEDAGEIADLGLWEHVENVTAVITDVSAQGYAEALLAAKIASKDEIVRLQTRALGFHPGQTMTIASFSRLLAGDYLITQVDTGSESGGILLVRSITASKSQNNTHDWRRVYQQWAGASAATEST